MLAKKLILNEDEMIEKLNNTFKDLSNERKLEIVDFAEYLKLKENSEFDKLVDKCIEENLEALTELAK